MYINGLVGVVGQQVRFTMPSSLNKAVQVIITVMSSGRNRLTLSVFSAKRDGDSQQAIVWYNCGKKGRYARYCRFRGQDFSEDNGRAKQVAGGRRPGANGHVLNHARQGCPKGSLSAVFVETGSS